jgi:hypothetical protein
LHRAEFWDVNRDVTGFEPATPCLQIQKTKLDGEKEDE